MIRVLGSCLLLLLLACPLLADATDAARKRPRLGGSEILLELDRRLDLSESQEARIMRMKERFQRQHAEELSRLRQEVLEVRQALQAAKKNRDRAEFLKARNRVRALRAAGEELRTKFEEQLLTLLTDEQKEKYRELKKEQARKNKPKPKRVATPDK